MERTHLDVEDEEWAPLEAWDDWRIVGNSDAVTEAISHRELIREVWPEFRTMTDAALDRMLGETMAEMSPLEIENFWKGLGRVAQSVGKTLVQAAPAVLPVVGGAVGTLIGGPAGTALGSTLGRFAGQAVGQAAGRGRAAVPRRPHGAAVQAGPPTAHPGPAGAGAAPPSAVPAGSSGALGQLMALIQDPALLQRLLGALMGSASPAPIGNTETSAGIGGFLNAVECLAAEAAREVHQLANTSGGVPEYLLDEHGAPAIYFRPPNEATLIYTPSMRQIEVCAHSPMVRQEIAASFAEVALGHDVSQKPLTWKRYNLSRFRTSLRLEVPKIQGYEIKFARVLEAEIRLGTWRRKLLLKVAVDDDIEDVSDRYLRPHNIFRRADGFSRISVAVSYNRVGDDKERTLNITISGTKSCNLQSNKDPEERSLGFALLQEWGILRAFRQIDPNDLRAMFPKLVELHDRVEDEVSGGYLRELGLDPDRLIQGGLLERRDRQDVVLTEDDDMDGEGAIEPSAIEGMVRTIGPFGEDAGERPASDLEMYAINRQWLHETVLRLMKPLLVKRTSQILDPDLTLTGAMQIDGAEVPVHVARRLDDLKTVGKLDLALRARNKAGVGIVLAASPELPSCLGPNVVVSLLTNVSPQDDEFVLSRDGLELAFRNSFSLARGGATPQVLRSGKLSATLHVPGKDALNLIGGDQITIFERLVAAEKAGSPDVQVKELMHGLGSRSPQQAFRNEAWPSRGCRLKTV